MKKEDLIAKLDSASYWYADRGKEVFANWGPFGVHALIGESDECRISISFSIWQSPDVRTHYFGSIEEAKAQLIELIMFRFLYIGAAELLKLVRL